MYLGGVAPFGQRLNEAGTLEWTDEGKAAVQRMVRMRRRGMSLRKIAAAISADGAAISYATVAAVLRRERKPLPSLAELRAKGFKVLERGPRRRGYIMPTGGAG